MSPVHFGAKSGLYLCMPPPELRWQYAVPVESERVDSDRIQGAEMLRNPSLEPLNVFIPNDAAHAVGK